MISILVTGATGFVGTVLIPRLINQGHTVRAVRRMGRDSPAGEANSGDQLSWHSLDEIGPQTDWSAALRDIDIVIHLAARVHVMRRERTDAETYYQKVNTAGTEMLARAAIAAGVRRFVFVSSIKAVAGDQAGTILTEDMPAVPDSPYGRSKWEAEQALRRLGAETGLEAVILRPPLIFGPGVKGNFRRLLHLCDSRFPLPLDGLDNRRSLLSLDNFVDALVLVCTHPLAAGQTFHVADEPPLSTGDLVHRIRRNMGRPARLAALPKAIRVRMNHVPGFSSLWSRLAGSLVMDSSRIRSRLNWTPPIGLDDALAVTVRWHQSIPR